MGTQRFSSAKGTEQTECHKCGKKGHFARDCWSKTSVPSYQSHFQPKPLHSSENKPEMRNTKNFEDKYNKVKAKLALFSSSASAPSSFSSKNKGLIAESYDWDEEEVSSDDEEIEVKVLMALTNEERISCINEQIPTQKKKILGIGQLTEDTSSFGSKDLVLIKSLADNSDMSITSSNLHKSYEAEDSNLSNHNTNEVPSNKSQRNTTGPSTVVSNSPASDYDSADESSVCCTPFFPLKKLDGSEPSSGPKSVKSILKSKSIFKAKTLLGITLNEPSSAPARGNKSFSPSKTISDPAGKLKNINVKDDPPLDMVMKELNELKLQISKKKSSYSRNKNTQQDKHGLPPTKRLFKVTQLDPTPELIRSWGIEMETQKIQDADVLSKIARKNLHRAFKNFNDFESFGAAMRYFREKRRMNSFRSDNYGFENFFLIFE
nr:hypothetical protein [Tanacetum cinerariifolium]